MKKYIFFENNKKNVKLLFSYLGLRQNMKLQLNDEFYSIHGILNFK